MRVLTTALLAAALISSPSFAETPAPDARPTATECRQAAEAYREGKKNPARWTVSQCIFHGVLTLADLK